MAPCLRDHPDKPASPFARLSAAGDGCRDCKPGRQHQRRCRCNASQHKQTEGDCTGWGTLSLERRPRTCSRCIFSLALTIPPRPVGLCYSPIPSAAGSISPPLVAPTRFLICPHQTLLTQRRQNLSYSILSAHPKPDSHCSSTVRAGLSVVPDVRNEFPPALVLSL